MSKTAFCCQHLQTLEGKLPDFGCSNALEGRVGASACGMNAACVVATASFSCWLSPSVPGQTSRGSDTFCWTPSPSLLPFLIFCSLHQRRDLVRGRNILAWGQVRGGRDPTTFKEVRGFVVVACWGESVITSLEGQQDFILRTTGMKIP